MQKKCHVSPQNVREGNGMLWLFQIREFATGLVQKMENDISELKKY